MNKFSFPPNKNGITTGQGVIISLLVTILLGNVFYLGYNTYEKQLLENEDNKKGLEKLALIEEILDKNYLYSEDVSKEQAFDGAAHGLASSMGDPYTRYVSEREYEEFTTLTSGSFGGIGVTVQQTDTSQGLIISDVTQGFSAEEAGLKKDDIIIEVDNQPVNEMELSDAIGLIRGQIGTSVTLKVKTTEGEIKTVILNRQPVELPNVSGTMLDDEVGYIKMDRFSENSVLDVLKHYEELKNPKSLIIDIRNNTGGLVTEAVKFTSLFKEEGETVVQVKGKNHTTTLKTEKSDTLIEIPVVLLVNEGSASASEILAGSIQGLDNVTIIGNKTYGKGLIQKSVPVDNESALIITVSEYLTPEGEQINGKGITPDIVISQSPEDILKGIDSALAKSLEYLKEKE